MEYDRDDRALRLDDIEEHFTRFRTTNSKLEADLDKNLDVCKAAFGDMSTAFHPILVSSAQ